MGASSTEPAPPTGKERVWPTSGGMRRGGPLGIVDDPDQGRQARLHGGTQQPSCVPRAPGAGVALSVCENDWVFDLAREQSRGIDCCSMRSASSGSRRSAQDSRMSCATGTGGSPRFGRDWPTRIHEAGASLTTDAQGADHVALEPAGNLADTRFLKARRSHRGWLCTSGGYGLACRQCARRGPFHQFDIPSP